MYLIISCLFTVFAHFFFKKQYLPLFLLPWWLSSKETTCNAGTTGNKGSILGSGRSPGAGHGNPLQNSCLENSTNRGTWQAIDQRVTKSQTWLKRLSTHNLFLVISRNSLYILYLIHFCFFFFKTLFTYLFLVVLDLCWRAQTSPGFREQRLLWWWSTGCRHVGLSTCSRWAQ